MIKNILFVCTGNTCRSIMAEGLFKKIFKEKGENSLRNIQSAGTAVIPGILPTPEAILVMSEQNIDISKHHSQSINEDLIKNADLILVMTNEHREYILKKFPFANYKIFLLKKYAFLKKADEIESSYQNYEIIDPIGKPIEFYRITVNELEFNLKKIADMIVNNKNR